MTPRRAGRSVALALLLAGCAPGAPPSPPPVDPARQVMRLADEYVSRYFQRSPEAATRRGLPADNGGVVDNSLAAVADWRLREDGWLRELRQVDTTALARGPAWPIYGLSPSAAEGEVDRYISWPGQATAYMLGSLTILAVRREAEKRLGSRFDIREFHDQLLGAGTITLPMLQERMERWIEAHP